MHQKSAVDTMIAGLNVGVTRSAMDSGMAKLTPLHREIVSGMPRGESQEIRVLFATLLPGDVTPYHSHRFPVTVYVIEGEFTLKLDGRDPVQIKQGEAFVEPANVNMTGSNEGKTPLTTALFYVCDPDTPFADPAQR